MLKKYNVLITLGLVGVFLFAGSTILALRFKSVLDDINNTPNVPVSQEFLTLSRTLPTTQYALSLRMGDGFYILNAVIPIHYIVRAYVGKEATVSYIANQLPSENTGSGLDRWSRNCFGRPASQLDLAQSAYAWAKISSEIPVLGDIDQMQDYPMGWSIEDATNVQKNGLLLIANAMGLISDLELEQATAETVTCRAIESA